ncbi:serine/arginine-rich splicing factor SR45 [Nematostella vectensis]|uniref:serine/arginine-rich splicing factor SR45 n=1 Tax=Nematostella vectensis TaxID=45351 RepID=UPI002077705F|nr:serine/arginine-rich splicing factor SR45 [Nematostella vectensis]
MSFQEGFESELLEPQVEPSLLSKSSEFSKVLAELASDSPSHDSAQKSVRFKEGDTGDGAFSTDIASSLQKDSFSSHLDNGISQVPSKQAPHGHGLPKQCELFGKQGVSSEQGCSAKSSIDEGAVQAARAEAGDGLAITHKGSSSRDEQERPDKEFDGYVVFTDARSSSGSTSDQYKAKVKDARGEVNETSAGTYVQTQPQRKNSIKALSQRIGNHPVIAKAKKTSSRLSVKRQEKSDKQLSATADSLVTRPAHQHPPKISILTESSRHNSPKSSPIPMQGRSPSSRQPTSPPSPRQPTSTPSPRQPTSPPSPRQPTSLPLPGQQTSLSSPRQRMSSPRSPISPQTRSMTSPRSPQSPTVPRRPISPRPPLSSSPSSPLSPSLPGSTPPPLSPLSPRPTLSPRPGSRSSLSPSPSLSPRPGRRSPSSPRPTVVLRPAKKEGPPEGAMVSNSIESSLEQVPVHVRSKSFFQIDSERTNDREDVSPLLRRPTSGSENSPNEARRRSNGWTDEMASVQLSPRRGSINMVRRGSKCLGDLSLGDASTQRPSTPDIMSPTIGRRLSIVAHGQQRRRSKISDELSLVASLLIHEASVGDDDVALPEVSLSDVMKSWNASAEDKHALSRVIDKRKEAKIDFEAVQNCRYLRNTSHEDDS